MKCAAEENSARFASSVAVMMSLWMGVYLDCQLQSKKRQLNTIDITLSGLNGNTENDSLEFVFY